MRTIHYRPRGRTHDRKGTITINFSSAEMSALERRASNKDLSKAAVACARWSTSRSLIWLNVIALNFSGPATLLVLAAASELELWVHPSFAAGYSHGSQGRASERVSLHVWLSRAD